MTSRQEIANSAAEQDPAAAFIASQGADDGDRMQAVCWMDFRMRWCFWKCGVAMDDIRVIWHALSNRPWLQLMR